LARRSRVRIGKRCHAPKSRHRFHQNFLSLAVEFSGEDADAGRIAAGLGQRVHQSLPDHIVS
jgi:hypothetical protein